MKRFVLAAIAYAVFLAAVAGGWYLWEHRPSDDGPLDGGGGITYGDPIDAGRAMSWGAALLTNLGTEPAVVERARLLRSTANLELLGIHSHLVGHGHTEKDQLLIGDRSGFPLERYPSRPLREQNVVRVPDEYLPNGSPAEGLQIVFGLRMAQPAGQPGLAGGSDVEVTYRVGSRRYREVYRYAVYLCAPELDYHKHPCPPEEFRGKFEDRALG